MERYNLPSNGIEVIISKGQITAQDPDPYHRPNSATANQNRVAPKAKKTANKSKKSIQYFATRSLFVVASIAALGNVPFASNTSDIPTNISNVDLLEKEAQQAFKPSSLEQDEVENVVFTGFENSNNPTTLQVAQDTSKAEPSTLKLLDTKGENSLTNEELVAEPQKPIKQDKPQNLQLTQTTNTSTPETLKPTNAIITKKLAETKPIKKPQASKSGRWRLYTQKKTQTLKAFLASRNLNSNYEALSNNKKIAKTLRKLKKGRQVITRTKGKKLNQLLYVQSSKKAFVITRYGSEYRGQWEKGKFRYQDTKVSFKIRSNIVRSAKNSGIPSHVATQLASVIKKDVSLRRLRRGDVVNLVYESFRYDNQSIDSRNLLATEIKHRGKRYQRIRYTLRGKTRYLSPNNSMQAKRTSFDRRPVRSGRVSSNYGYRRHPISGRKKLHKGMDIAAPRGTPIYATGGGRIKFSGRQRGYGKVVEIRHAGNITTLYAHMSRIRSGIRNGTKVKRGQIIGYVGSTGRSTGNHVHYEFRVNGAPRNPARVALPQTGIFSSKEIRDFKRFAASMLRKLAQADNKRSRRAKSNTDTSDS